MLFKVVFTSDGVDDRENLSMYDLDICLRHIKGWLRQETKDCKRSAYLLTESGDRIEHPYSRKESGEWNV